MQQAHIETYSLNGNSLFGLGARNGPFLVPEALDIYTFWNSNGMNKMDGYQPFYMFQNQDKTFVGVFDLSTYAFDYIVDNDRSGGEVLITHILTGGPVEKYVLMGATPLEVLMKYQKLTGKPMVPPEWAFGWQHAKEGLISGADWKKIADDYMKNKVPLDSLWAGVEATEDFKSFTFSEEKYPKMKDVITDLKANNISVVPVVESGISMLDGNNPAYTSSGKDVFVMSADGKPGVGSQFHNKVVYPDFTNSKTSPWWSSLLKDFHANYTFAGLWFDKNEVSSDCDGFCYPYNQKGLQVPLKDVESELMYVPGDQALDKNTLDLSAKYASGATEFEMHNTFPFW